MAPFYPRMAPRFYERLRFCLRVAPRFSERLRVATSQKNPRPKDFWGGDSCVGYGERYSTGAENLRCKSPGSCPAGQGVLPALPALFLYPLAEALARGATERNFALSGQSNLAVVVSYWFYSTGSKLSPLTLSLTYCFYCSF